MQSVNQPKANSRMSVTLILVAINAVIFFASSGLPLLVQKLALYFPENQSFKIWQLASHMFMHGGLTHLLFNMFALFSFGVILEKLWGVKRFLFFYFTVGVGAAVMQLAVNYFLFANAMSDLSSTGLSEFEVKSMLEQGKYIPTIEASETASRIFNTPMVGASGAIYGTLVAFACLFPNHKLILIFLPFPIAAKYFVPAILSLDLFSGITGFSIFGGNIAHFAHLGGALIGFILMVVWSRQGFNRRNFIQG